MIQIDLKSLIVLIFLALCTTPVLAASLPEQAQRAAVSLGAEFSSGDYGTEATTRTLYLPLVVTWLPNDRIDLGIEIPFIYQSSSTVTTNLFRASQTTTTAQAAGRGGPGGNTQPQTGLATTSPVSTASTSSVSGPGDMILRLGVIALLENGNVPQLRPSLFVKCPTARSSDGLGTGEYDAGIGIDAAKWFGRMNLSGEGLYTWQGRATGFGLKDYLSWTAGVGYELMEGVRPMLILKGATAPSTYSGNLLEARARILWSLSPRTGLDLYASQGLAASSPDYGGGLAVSYLY